MADGTSPDANAPVSGEVAAIAAEAQTTAAEAAGTVAAVAEKTETAVEEITEELEDETLWLKERLTNHETTMREMGETISRLPQAMAEALQPILSEALKSLTPQNSPASNPVETVTEGNSGVTKENPVEAVAETIAAPIKKGIRYL